MNILKYGILEIELVLTRNSLLIVSTGSLQLLISKCFRVYVEDGKRGAINMSDKLTPDITPQLAISAFTVLHQYCSSISPHDCIRCTFYEHCPECFMGCPGDQGEVIRKLQSNE